MNGSEGVDCILNDADSTGLVCDRIPIGDCLAAHGCDFLDHGVGSTTGASAIDGPSEVIDHNLGAALGEFDGVTAAETTSRTGYNHDLVFEFRHNVFPLLI
jgi:hypothetical protein